MKYIKLYIIIIFIVVVLVCGCTDMGQFVPIENYNSKVSELEEANNIIDTRDNSIADLEEEVGVLEGNLGLGNEELEKYKYLLANLNSLLSNVYYGYAENDEWILDGFTAFSIEYNGRFYLIAPGHAVEDEDGRYYNHRFKANFSDGWIYPKLLFYDNDYMKRNDYAIFYSDKIDDGFVIDDDNDLPKYILGSNKLNKNIIKTFNDETLGGESGSPIVDYEGEIIGINTTDIHSYFTKIDIILEAIDNLE